MTELTPKQKDVMDSFIQENPKIILASGAKRAGKTFVFILLFLMHIAKYEGQGLSFIIGGATQASIRRNILNDMEVILGKELNLNKSNAVSVFGNKIYCFDGANSDTWKKVRGFTATKEVNDQMIENHLNRLEENIMRLAKSVNFSDESFAGNTSGVAMKFKLMALENNAKRWNENLLLLYVINSECCVAPGQRKESV
ncbi:hypothetical protein LSPH24S_06356 [Lysinibacillus sphaericus]